MFGQFCIWFSQEKKIIFKATTTKLQRWPRIWKIYFLWKPYSATYQMNQNFIKINNMLLKNRLKRPKNIFMKNKARNIEFFIYFKKRLRKDFLLDGSWFVCSWIMQKCKKPHSYIILVSNLVWDSSVPLSPISPSLPPSAIIIHHRPHRPWTFSFFSLI